MLKQELINIKDFILSKNPYFDKGFERVWQDETTGLINDGNDEIFPADNLGNYFYMRLPKNYGFGYNDFYTTTQCNRPLVVNTQIILVAFMRDADDDKLLSNLINTIQQYKPNQITIITGENKAEIVIAQELSKIPKENIAKALATFDPTYSLVSVTFTYQSPFVFEKLSCLTKPCKTC